MFDDAKPEDAMSDTAKSDNRISGAEYLPIGKVIGVHGLKGTLKLISYAETMAPFASGNNLLLGDDATGAQWFRIQSGKPYKKIVRVKLAGIESRDQAEALVGSVVYLDKATLPETDADSYYWFDLIGLKVEDKASGRRLGTITGVLPTGGHDVYVVNDTRFDPPKEVLIPAVAAVVQTIDVENQKMEVNLPQGLE